MSTTTNISEDITNITEGDITSALNDVISGIKECNDKIGLSQWLCSSIRVVDVTINDYDRLLNYDFNAHITNEFYILLDSIFTNVGRKADELLSDIHELEQKGRACFQSVFNKNNFKNYREKYEYNYSSLFVKFHKAHKYIVNYEKNSISSTTIDKLSIAIAIISKFDFNTNSSFVKPMLESFIKKAYSLIP